MEVPQRFCVRWNSYKSNLQTAFPKLLTSEHFVDVTLACEKQFIKCHKIVLSACSVYFETLLVNNPCQHPIIFMKDVEFWEIKALVEFMYKGEVNVSQNQLDSLLKSAESLQIRGLSGTKQFVNLDQSDDSCSESKGKRIKSDNEEDEEGVKKRKKKNDDEEKFVQITSVRGADELLNENLEENEGDLQKVVKEETIEQEEYEYDNNFVEPREEDQGEVYNADFYNDQNEDPGPSGISGCWIVKKENSNEKKSEFISIDQLSLQDYSLQSEDDANTKKTKLLSVKTEPETSLKVKKPTARRSCYKQYTMASMWAALERIEQGVSVYKASLEYGVPRKTLRNWMKKYNILSYFDLKKQEREKHEVVDV